MKKIKVFVSGEKCKEGIYSCLNCGQKIYLENNCILKNCAKCGLNKFIFER